MKYSAILYNTSFYKQAVEIFRLALSFTKSQRMICVRTLTILFLGCATVSTLHAQDTLRIDMSSVSSNQRISASETRPCIITGSTSSYTVTVESGFTGTILLRNLTITRTSGNSCITVLGQNGLSNMTPLTRVELLLEGTNELLFTGSYSCALQVDQGAQIHINAIDRNDNASGVLIAKSTAYTPGVGGSTYNNSGAGIGAPTLTTPSLHQGGAYPEIHYKPEMGSSGCRSSNVGTAGGNVIIGSGTVTAWGGHGAGIGGGYLSFYDGVIIVYGGVVTARALRHSAGIGSGCPYGSGLVNCYTQNSAIIALPPAEITSIGAGEPGGDAQIANPEWGLAGANNITYMNDPNKPHITLRTVDREPGINIYLDLTETPGLKSIFTQLGIDYNLSRVKAGRTNAAGTDLEKPLHGRFEEATTFFTDASSTNPLHYGRPYMPVSKTVLVEETIELPLLTTEIVFTDYPSTPLEVGYTAENARANAHVIKMEYKDPDTMDDVTFALQDGIDFPAPIFLKEDSSTVVMAPTKLKSGDVYYILLPVKVGKPLGIYSDVLLIGGKWDGAPLPGYIRRIGEQRVVHDDSGENKYIKVTADPDKFVVVHPTTKTVELTLNVDHTGTDVLYDPADVVANYLITTEADYAAALASTPVKNWSKLEIPVANGQDRETIVTFDDLPKGTYYIHWLVRSGVVYAHSQTVTVPPHQYGGFGPYMLTDPVTAGKLRGNPAACRGKSPMEIKGEVSTGGSGDFSYQWMISTDGTSWSSVGGTGTGVNYSPEPLSVSPTFFRRISLDNQSSVTYPSDNDFGIYLVEAGEVLYWRLNAPDHNWFNSDNWVDAAGNPIGAVPVSCANVVIPGGAANYPSLDSINTPMDICGTPVCGDIVFGAGAELPYQHMLTYERAFVQYNWGYYDDFSDVNFGTQPPRDTSDPAAPFNERGKWHALAVPLKSVATGDFGFVGYPLSWQAGFALADSETGIKDTEVEVGDFSRSFSANDVPLSETNNAIAVKVALYDHPVGYSDHRNLEGMKGQLEIPYFENSSRAEYYPGHVYNGFTGESKFFYFNPLTLQLIHSPVGIMKRGGEAYRFIYEKENTAPLITVPGSTPSSVPGYKQVVKRQHGSSLKVMIGNPFVSAINSKRFFDANAQQLDASAGYQLFNSSKGIWEHYTPSLTAYIPSYQAFIVTILHDEVELLYPFEGTYALTDLLVPDNSAPLEVANTNLYLRSVSDRGLGGDCAVLVSPDQDEALSSVKKMIHPEGCTTPETFFIAPDAGTYNLIQPYDQVVNEVGIGVKTSDTETLLSLTFENIEAFSEANRLKPVLQDKYLGVTHDLSVDNTYCFNQRKKSAEENFVDSDRFVLRFQSAGSELSKEVLSDVRIVYADGLLNVWATRNIKQIMVYDIYGRLAHSEREMNVFSYSGALSLNAGIYMVKVYTSDGKIIVRKIVEM